MKKSMLFCGLLSFSSGLAYANTPTPPAASGHAKNTVQPAATKTPAPVTPASTDTKKPAVPTAAATPVPIQVMNCDYKIPAETKHIESSLVQKWAEKAAQQSFDFDPTTLDAQLTALKACYTAQGWQSFYDALQQSGNIKAIQSQNLMVSSMVDGTVTVSEAKDNQWKVSMPMQVVYQNENEKLTQGLTIDLLVGRKPTGDLGIMQIIASPRQEISTGIDTSPASNDKKPDNAPTEKTKP